MGVLGLMELSNAHAFVKAFVKVTEDLSALTLRSV